MKVCIREIVNVCARIGINKCREYKRYSFIDTLSSKFTVQHGEAIYRNILKANETKH